MRRPKLPLIPSLLVLLKEDTNVSQVLASLNELPVVPKERFSNTESHCLSFVFIPQSLNVFPLILV